MIALLLAAALALSQQLSDEEETRAQALMNEIRCVVCEGQPISESNAELAQDMRVVVRELVSEGRTDAEVRDWMADRYGESALLRPRAESGGGRFLWLAPLAIAAGVMLVLVRVMRFDRNVNKTDPD